MPTVTPDKSALSTTQAAHGYRLTGSGLDTWSGRRVQIIGSIVPPPPDIEASPSGTAGAPRPMAMPEFRVQSVQPIAGNCP